MVRDEFGGHGLASRLVKEALDDSITAGYRVVVLCPYIQKWLTKHEEYQQYVDQPTRDHLKVLGLS